MTNDPDRPVEYTEPRAVMTADGTHTLRHPVLDDTYHSVNGAMTESLYVFIDNGFKKVTKPRIRVFEAGFGSGLNALLTLREAERANVDVEYTTAELYPVSPSVAAGLCYAEDPVFTALHTANWGSAQRITRWFTLTKLAVDLADMEFATIFDLVYYDAFSPDTQPRLWSGEIFGKLFRAMSAGGILVTYSAKGDVKRALRSVGFDVSRLPGAPGKRHMVRAEKPG